MTALDLRLVLELDSRSALVRLAQTRTGKLALLACFAVLLRLLDEPSWLVLTALVAAPTFAPEHRRLLVAVGTLGYALTRVPSGVLAKVAARERLGTLPDSAWLVPAATLGTLALCVLYARAVHRAPCSVLARRPIASLLTLHALLLGFGVSGVLGGAAQLGYWALLAGLTQYLWFLGYTLKDKTAARDGELLLQAGAFLPFWSHSLTPFPKGASYLSKIEAKTPEALAVCQLKGIKLALWALCLRLLGSALGTILHGTPGFLSRVLDVAPSLGIPTYAAALDASTRGQAFAAHLSWLALVSTFALKLLHVSLFGHVIIAICRMSGFSALRNTYKPLSSRSLADFWNRVYYYFKELLVEFFFYPAFFRCFRNHPRLRLLFSTFAAAGVGNFLYHYLIRVDEIYERGLWGQLVAMQTYALYALLLSLAIGISQLRSQARPARRPENEKHARARTLASVLGFYCLLTILDEAGSRHTLEDCWIFTTHLLGG